MRLAVDVPGEVLGRPAQLEQRLLEVAALGGVHGDGVVVDPVAEHARRPSWRAAPPRAPAGRWRPAPARGSGASPAAAGRSGPSSRRRRRAARAARRTGCTPAACRRPARRRGRRRGRSTARAASAGRCARARASARARRTARSPCGSRRRARGRSRAAGSCPTGRSGGRHSPTQRTEVPVMHFCGRRSGAGDGLLPGAVGRDVGARRAAVGAVAARPVGGGVDEDLAHGVAEQTPSRSGPRSQTRVARPSSDSPTSRSATLAFSVGDVQVQVVRVVVGDPRRDRVPRHQLVEPADHAAVSSASPASKTGRSSRWNFRSSMQSRSRGPLVQPGPAVEVRRAGRRPRGGRRSAARPRPRRTG